MKSILFPVLLLLPFMALALPNEATLNSYVPNGKIIQTKKKEIKVQTSQNSIVEIEFDTDGAFEEASGDDIDKDVLQPGQGLISLTDAVTSVRKERKNLTGEWSLEKHFFSGWVYEFEGFDAGINKKMEFAVDAKTGRFIGQKIDD